MYMYDFLHQSETVLMEGNANKIQSMRKKTGGRLILTNERLIFEYALTGCIESIDVKDLCVIEKTINMLIPSIMTIKSVKNQRRVYHFAIKRGEKYLWLNTFRHIDVYIGKNVRKKQEKEMYVSDSNNRTPKVYLKFILLELAVLILCGFLFVVGKDNNDNEKNEIKSENNKILTEAEEKDAIYILNSTQYLSNIPSKTYGQIINRAFIDYTLEFSKKSDSKCVVKVKGLFMLNPNIKSNYLELKTYLGESQAKEMLKDVMYNITLVFEVDLEKKSVTPKSLSDVSSSLQAYALDGF